MALINVNDIIKRPVISEKTAKGMQLNVYAFEVDKRATKTDVKRAIELIFAPSNAKVKKINIQNVKPQPKKLGKFAGFVPGYKKAIVTLASGVIPVYGAQGIENNEDTSAGKKKRKPIQIIDTDKIMEEAEKAGK